MAIELTNEDSYADWLQIHVQENGGAVFDDDNHGGTYKFIFWHDEYQMYFVAGYYGPDEIDFLLEHNLIDKSVKLTRQPFVATIDTIALPESTLGLSECLETTMTFDKIMHKQPRQIKTRWRYNANTKHMSIEFDDLLKGHGPGNGIGNNMWTQCGTNERLKVTRRQLCPIAQKCLKNSRFFKQSLFSDYAAK